MEKCRFGHVCTSSCGNDKECPCQSEHCCALTKGCEGCDDHYVKKEAEGIAEAKVSRSLRFQLAK